ncbi:MAG TPA: hypothetical protein H9902_09915, partial [Candidatus Stackebrandtia faecavium]|nr:hypothetical protein [Candidatus Stackebrandtia faecavium]
HQRLSEFGLELDDIHQALAYGHAEINQCTDMDHPTFWGWTMYSRTGRRLREVLVQRGWNYKDYKGQMRISNRSGMSIMHGYGDSLTADPSPMATPSHKNNKGPVTSKAIKDNSQLPLFDVSLYAKSLPNSTGNWLLLYRIEEERILSELSFPNGFVNGKVTFYRERIILPELETGTEIVIPRDDDLEDDHDFEVKRRA